MMHVFRGIAACLLAASWFLLPTASASPSGSCLQPLKGSGQVPSVGTIRSLLFFIDFPDAPANESIQSTVSMTQPLEVIDFVQRSSLMQFGLDTSLHTSQVYRMPQPATSYHYTANLSAETHSKYVSDALAAVGTSISFKGIDLVWIVSPSSTNGSIPYTTAGFFNPVTADNVTLKGVITTGIDLFTRNSTLVLTRGLAYSIGLKQQCPPSLGDNADDSTFLGSFSPMCDDFAPAPDFLGMQKWTLGWYQGDQDVTCLNSTSSASAVDKTLTLTAVENAASGGSPAETPHVRLAVLPLTDSLALYAEARTHNGLDSNACLVDSSNTGGVLLYTAEPVGEARDQLTVNVINAQSDHRPVGCGGSPGSRAFVDLLVFNSSSGLASTYTMPEYGVRVEVVSASTDGTQFGVRFQASYSSSTAPSMTSAVSSTTASASAVTTATSRTTSVSPSGTSTAAATTTSPSSGLLKTRVELGGVILSILASLFAGI